LRCGFLSIFTSSSGGIVGVFVGILGIVFTLQNFGVFSLGDVQLFWPMLVVAFGLCRVFERSGRLEGAILLVVGGGVQLSNLGLFALPAREVMRYWPLTVVAAGLWELALSQGIRAAVEGFAIASLGMWLQLSYFGVVHISSYRLWPLVLVVVGCVMAWRGRYASGSY
jgi:LiaF transmembrane domain